MLRPFRNILVVMGLATSVTAMASAPAGRYAVTTATVTDTQTGLTWQRTATGDTYTQAAAAAFCANLNLGGASDWRLPNRVELESLVDDTRIASAIDSVFEGTAATFFWASNPYASDAEQGWYVHFYFGYSGISQITSAYRVRCVR